MSRLYSVMIAGFVRQNSLGIFLLEIRDHIFAEQIDGVHGLLVRERPELHHAQEQIEIGGLLRTLDLFDARIRIAHHAHAVVDQELQIDFTRIKPFVFFDLPVATDSDLLERLSGSSALPAPAWSLAGSCRHTT